ncbi:hypothetical protein [Flavobacterium cyanobacteriorum]|uniref:hypothetical protein n=1 Tax=Flavobacterium cyanobacteriorum TaxID=2022802 RepID=UPI0013FDA936|nr:hypothetical protein [Flavobacterium cyanobacteriorum]
MKFNKKIQFFFSSISKFRALASVVRPTYCLRIAPVIESFYSSANNREKLQIIYANIRV